MELGARAARPPAHCRERVGRELHHPSAGERASTRHPNRGTGGVAVALVWNGTRLAARSPRHDHLRPRARERSGAISFESEATPARLRGGELTGRRPQRRGAGTIRMKIRRVRAAIRAQGGLAFAGGPGGRDPVHHASTPRPPHAPQPRLIVFDQRGTGGRRDRLQRRRPRSDRQEAAPQVAPRPEAGATAPSTHRGHSPDIEDDRPSSAREDRPVRRLLRPKVEMATRPHSRSACRDVLDSWSTRGPDPCCATARDGPRVLRGCAGARLPRITRNRSGHAGRRRPNASHGSPTGSRQRETVAIDAAPLFKLVVIGT